MGCEGCEGCELIDELEKDGDEARTKTQSKMQRTGKGHAERTEPRKP